MKLRFNRARVKSTRALKPALLLSLIMLLLAGCSTLQPLIDLLPQQSTPAPNPGTPVAKTVIAPTPTNTPEPSPTPGPQVLTLWVPPQMDPAGGSQSAQLLQERLDEFAHANPDVIVRVRVKALTGPGGLLELLSAATAAAPDAVPSLVALPRTDLETAALKGLIYPLDGLSDVMNDPDWYSYAQQLAQVENSIFGLPFGGDALVLMYRPEKIGITPTDWPSVISLGRPVIFPAADTQSLVTLALYQSLGGTVQNDKRHPALEVDPLTKVLQLYASGAQAGCFPYWLAQYASDKDAWQAYGEQRANFMVTWASQYLTELPADFERHSDALVGRGSFRLRFGLAVERLRPRPRSPRDGHTPGRVLDQQRLPGQVVARLQHFTGAALFADCLARSVAGRIDRRHRPTRPAAAVQ